MNNTNGFHLSSPSMSNHGINDTTTCLTTTNDSNVLAIHKRIKSKSTTSITLHETQSIKKYNRKQKSINLKRKRLMHSDSNNNHKSTKKLKGYSHSNLEYLSLNKKEDSLHRTGNNNYCNSCGDCFGDMISCKICSATFHRDCINSSLSKNDTSKDSYFCEHCRNLTKTQNDLINKTKQQKLVQPFSFNPKKHLNGKKSNKTQQVHSKSGPINLLTAPNGQFLIQPSGDIKFRPVTNTNDKYKHLSSNLKRRRIDSSTSTNCPMVINSISNTANHLDALHRLFVSSQTEEFHGPSSNDSNYNQDQKYCFTCRKSTSKQGPSIHCNYCPLSYHIDCLTPPMTSLPLLNEKWMCPNHIEPILDRCLIGKTNVSTNERVKIYTQYPKIEQNFILQEFSHVKQTKDNFLSTTINNHRLESVNISQIPKSIEHFYLEANTKQKSFSNTDTNDDDDDTKEENRVQTTVLSRQTSDPYDPCIWDIIQAILDHIVNNTIYEISSLDDSSIGNDHLTTARIDKQSNNNLDSIDILLQALNEPTYIVDQCTDQTITSCDISMTTKNEELPEKQNEQQINKSTFTHEFSHLIDLSQFRLSHAALIHLNSQNVIYIRKHVIWFGSSPSNDICLNNISPFPKCPYITERHACLYYDRKNNLFELLNYSEYGTIVNDLRYGLNTINDTDYYVQENDNLPKCFCLAKSSHRSSWDGPAQIEQGTVIKLGCHEFLFYRFIAR